MLPKHIFRVPWVFYGIAGCCGGVSVNCAWCIGGFFVGGFIL